VRYLLNNPDEAAATLGSVIEKAQTGELRGDQLKRIVSDWLASPTEHSRDGSRWSRAIEKMKVITGDQECARAGRSDHPFARHTCRSSRRNAANGCHRLERTVSKAMRQTLEQLLAKQPVDEAYRNSSSIWGWRPLRKTTWL
jgi:hypothetical protein